MTGLFTVVVMATGLLAQPSTPFSARITTAQVQSNESSEAAGPGMASEHASLPKSIPPPPPILIFIIGVSIMAGFGWIRRRSVFEDNRFRYETPADPGKSLGS